MHVHSSSSILYISIVILTLVNAAGVVMGLQIRKRSKGKDSWTNISNSGVSFSKKSGNVTTNVGPRGLRTTVNLGNGVRYVTTKGWSRKGKPGFLISMANSFIIFSIGLWLWHFGMQLYNSGVIK